jgi:hypothetical protein
LVWAAISYGASFDVDGWRYLGQAVLSGENPYGPAGHGRANWGPVWPWTCGLMLELSRLTPLPFHFLVKIPASLADAAIALLLRRLLLDRGLSPRAAFLAALGYALNPIAILISGAHGQFDAIPALFALGAFCAFPAVWPSALLLGLGIGTKTWVALLLPFFLQRLPDWRKRIAYFVLALLPFIVMLLPYYLAAPAAVRTQVLAYGGGVDHGWAAVVRIGLNLAHGARRLGEMTTPGWMLAVGRFLVLGGLIVVLVAARRRGLRTALEAALLCFYVTSAGVATQYLLWVLPFAYLGHDEEARARRVYIIVALIAALGFYLVFFPEAIFGERAGPFAQAILHSRARPAFAAIWILGTAAWWFTGAAWLRRHLREGDN